MTENTFQFHLTIFRTYNADAELSDKQMGKAVLSSSQKAWQGLIKANS